MGRSGGGGGGRSSGGFGGGRSSGGFSGGGRSSGGGFSGGGGRSSGPRNNYGGGPRRNPGPRPRGGGMFFFGGPRYYGAPPPPGGRRRRSGLLSTIIVILVMMSIVCCTMSAFIGTSNNYDTSYSSSVSENTTERTKLEGVVSKTDWYQDDLGWIRSPNQMITGLEDFYNQTGVQPYIAFIAYSDDYWNGNTFDTTAADEYLDEIYEEKFTDEGHFIFAYFACYNDSEDMDGEFRYLAGYSADTIMDNEALNIFEGYFNTYYYDTSLSIEQMISNTFSSTADSIMSTPTNGWDFARIAIIVVGVVAVVVVIYLILKNKAKRDKEREEYTKEILDKPLDTFGDEDLSDLEKKYK
ncbi:MAG: hypothetical protein LUG60_15205 [Erysipelotrichaceae bacterium]|nr:hypothetical protein [Erysipelotrichaceae bacterium]